jgi:hypothetical protein
MVSSLVSLRQSVCEAEQRNAVLKKFKALYKSVSEVKCSGCHKAFNPVLFKGHYLKCTKLVSDSSTSAYKDESKMVVRLVDMDSQSQLRFYLSYSGLTWYVKKDFGSLMETCYSLAQ